MIDTTLLWTAVYIAMLAAFTGYVVISRVPVILHTPLMSGSNFIHGIVLVGAWSHLALLRRRSNRPSALSQLFSGRQTLPVAMS